ncbi:MAG: hypothetical protein JEZ07_16435 [Phycisphaerae bacterium]|nr:hypothetical protein [Phycisphaerae bacterium]
MKKMILLILILAISGCGRFPDFPDKPIRVNLGPENQYVFVYDVDDNGESDYLQIMNAQGRKNVLLFTGDSPLTVYLDQIAGEDVPHFVIAMDGVPYPLVKELYDQGYFRLFYAPSKVVTTFPGMTDLAFQKLLGGRKPKAYQACHFDRKKNRIDSGNGSYLSGDAADWSNKLAYRSPFILDPLAYLQPDMMLKSNLKGIVSAFRKEKGNDLRIAYSVATAAKGTDGGREAILDYLRVVDQICEQIVHERQGKVKITLLADHGHNMAGRKRITFDTLLKEYGYNLTDSLKDTRDVVTIQYGLVTYASFFTNDPAGVAKALVHEPAVETVSYRFENKSVVVQTLDGKAVIRKSGDNYRYDIEYGDPLGYKDIIAKLKEQGKVDANGVINDRAMLTATIDHPYPDALKRIWCSFYELVEMPPDVVADIKGGYVHGSKLFSIAISNATSTHGGLDNLNSVTFSMTMLGELPGVMRLEDEMEILDKLRKGK